jgi:hypothetical protein
MQCPRCQHQNPPQAKFCLECGSRLASTCAQCGTALPVGAKFCLECGEPVSAPPGRSPSPQAYTPKHLAEKIVTSRSAIEGERKLVTVLFVDVSRFTALSETLDPEDVHQIMDRAFELMLAEVHRYEGTVNQFLGDGLMALFGAPIAHEDHAVRAARAALGIQRALAGHGAQLGRDRGIDFQVRMGLNSGAVVVGRIGDNLRMDYTAVGDTTNLAAASWASPSRARCWSGRASRGPSSHTACCTHWAISASRQSPAGQSLAPRWPAPDPEPDRGGARTGADPAGGT